MRQSAGRSILFSILLLAPLAGQTPRPSAIVDSAALLRDLKTLSADDMQGRRVGTPGGAKARAYVIERFKAVGIKPVGASYEMPFAFAGRGSGAEQTGVNVVGVVDGTRQPQQYIVVTAHYDHVGERNGEVFNGADDNASGTAALFALGEYFSKNRPAHSILFAALDGEESGLRGAHAFVKAPPVPAASIAINLNMDMIGRDPDDKLYVVGTRTQAYLKPFIERVAAKASITLLMGHDDPTQKEDWTTQSDQYAFCQVKIPCLYFGVEDFAQHHKATDDYETMSHDFYVRVVETMVAVVREFDGGLDVVMKQRAGTGTADVKAAPADQIALTIANAGVSTTAGLLMPEGTARAPVVLLVADATTSAALSDALRAGGVAAVTADFPWGISSDADETARRVAAIVSHLRNDVRFPLVTVLGQGARALSAAIGARAARADGFALRDGAAAGSAEAAASLTDEVGRMRAKTLTLAAGEDVARAAAEVIAFAKGVPALGRSGTTPARPALARRSLRDTVIARIGTTRIAIEYGRPSKRGRAIWGSLVPWDREWMPGADEATTLTTNRPIVIGTLEVPAGDHTLYAWPKADEFTLIVNREVGQFHTVYRADRDLGRVPMTMARRSEPVEVMTYEIDPAANVIKLIWDDREYRVPFAVKTPEP
ncbi:MAG TPA: M28 family peptidase [Vicinamibacterales bacterium]|nr:M28 family peptidase [Vicinamibacterales bacterium]